MPIQQLFIPTIGSEIKLAKPWTFALYDESRNDQMTLFQGLKPATRWSANLRKLKDVTLPAGTTMKVDRIYIRRGIEDYDSITFIVQQIPNQDIAVDDEVSDYKAAHKNGTSIFDTKKKVVRKKIRFWAKLEDINTMFIVL